MNQNGHCGHELSTLILDVDDLAKVVADVGLDNLIDELIAQMRTDIASFDAAAVQTKVRSGFTYDRPEHGLVEWMPTMAHGDVVSVKTVGYHPENPKQRSIPSVLATTSLYDTNTGALIALTEATLLTALRTGAASALVTDAVTERRPLTVGVVGCGAQAVTQIHALSRVREIASLIVTDVDQRNAESLSGRLPDGIVSPQVCEPAAFDLEVGRLDVLVTATSVELGNGPVVDLANASPHLHINAVGSDFPGKTELPLDFLRQAVVIADDVEQCLIEGESQRLNASDLGPDMVDVLARDWSPLTSQQTVFDSTGWAYEDLIAATVFMSHAIRLGLGTMTKLYHQPVDPYDPYEGLRSNAGPR